MIDPAPALPEETTLLFQFEIPLPPWAVIVLLAAAGFLFHLLLRTVLRAWAKRTATGLDDILVDISSRTVPLWVCLAILYVAIEMDHGRHRRLGEIGNAFVGAAFLLSLFWFVTALLLRTMESWAGKNAAFQPVHPPLRFVLKSVATAVAAVSVLTYLGVEVRPLLATLGVGGLAVALALRDTLENFFAGLHIMADRPVAEGDTVLVHETGSTGVVLKVGWRSTRIRTAENNILVVPNLKLSSGIVTNLTAKDASVNLRIQVGVSYASDPDRVREILLDEVKAAAGRIPGLSSKPEPEAWLHPGFGPTALEFTVLATVERADLALAAQDGLRRAIFRRLRAEGVSVLPTTGVEITRMPKA